MKKRWLDRWRLRRIIAILARPVTEGGDPAVLGFAKTLEATEIMTRGLKKGDEITMSVKREELTKFIRYMTTLHDAKISKLTTARIGLATLLVSDKEALGEDPKAVLSTEAAKSIRGKRSQLVGMDGDNMRMK